MEGDLATLYRDLQAALARYNAWEQPLRRFRAEHYRRLNQEGYTWEAHQRELAELEARLAAENDPYADLHRLFGRLCAAYIAADGEQQVAIRAFAADRKKLGQLLWRYANRLTQRVAAAGDADLVRAALAGVVIDNCSANYRDTLMTLADLYVAAESAGLDATALFREAAPWATDEVTPGGCESLAAMLRDFPRSSVLRERRGMAKPYGGPA